MVPKLEPLQLRQWFTDELHLVASVKNEEELLRLRRVVDYEGGRQLQTPRSVVRALDAVRFFWPPIGAAKGDLADLVWLQLIKDGNPSLYRWIERYCATVAVVSLGTARIGDADRAQELAALLETVSEGHFDDFMYRHQFAEQLPGVDYVDSEDGKYFRIFVHIPDSEREKAIRDRRLASPDHYRLYFALVGPTHALTENEFISTWRAAEEGADKVGAALLSLHDEPATGSLTKADLLLERTKTSAYPILTPTQCENILIAFSQVMDEAYRRHPFDLFWVGSLWDRGERLVSLLFSRLDKGRRDGVVSEMFGGGSAVGWLTRLFRHETFAHGRYGDRQRPENEWLFTNAELDRITELMLSRYRAMSARDVFRCPSPMNLLFAWRQAGDEQGPRHLIGTHVISDNGLVEVLEHLTDEIESSDRGKFDVLKEEYLAPFIDYDSARQRIEALKNDSQLGSRASRLAIAFDLGKEY